ncbi:hypothetical protein DMH27_13245 [Raoultella planticola]|nr:hypothetical protein [Raoultella planticola]
MNEPETPADLNLPHPFIALLPLMVVGIANLILRLIPLTYGGHFLIDLPGLKAPLTSDVKRWSPSGPSWRRCCAVLSPSFVCRRSLKGKLADGSKVAVGGAMLASLNTASEYGFGGVIAALPGFVRWPMR